MIGTAAMIGTATMISSVVATAGLFPTFTLSAHPLTQTFIYGAYVWKPFIPE
jgi:hypothetical protein